MKCIKCSGKAAIKTEKPFCKEHFIEYFEDKVVNTIEKYSLISKKDKIAVAASGGKDSTALLHIINRYFGNVTAIAIDEGIPGYRDKTLEDLNKFCDEQNIPLKIYSYEREFGFKLQDAVKEKNIVPCRSCGILRRYLLNKMSSSFTKIATGHNMDDELQSFLMNMMNSNIELMARGGPVTGVIKNPGFTPRIKPLIFCTEKEVAAYSLLKGFDIKFTECPNAKESFRAKVRDLLNELEAKNPGIKRKLIKRYMGMLPALKEKYREKISEIRECLKCGHPSENDVCAACRTVEMIRA